MKLLAVIPARGGSKGLPGKNIKPFCGKPLIAWSISCAMDCPSLTRVIVSTDDEAIAAVARDAGADVPWLRPKSLADDGAATADVLRHALDTCEADERAEQGEAFIPYEGVVLLQPTSPLREARDVQTGLDLWRMTGATRVVSVCRAEHPPAWLVEIAAGGVLTPWQGAPDLRAGRQSHAPLYRYNGAVYVYSASRVREGRSASSDDTRAFLMPGWRSADIDTLEDFVTAESLHMNRRLFDDM